MSGQIMGSKSPVLALILNLCFGWLGIGYFYIGQWQKALVAIAVFFLTFGTLGTIVWILSIIDVFLQAKVLQDGGAIGHWTFFTGRA